MNHLYDSLDENCAARDRVLEMVRRIDPSPKAEKANTNILLSPPPPLSPASLTSLREALASNVDRRFEGLCEAKAMMEELGNKVNNLRY